MNHLLIETNQSGIWFSLIYLFTIILVNSVFIFKGLKDRYSIINLWLVAIAGMLFFIAGLNLFPHSLSEIKLFILEGKLAHAGEKSLLGGILGFGGLLLAIYWLKERIAVIDNMAIVFIIGIGLQNIGCLKAGCCYGTQSTIPWAVQYDNVSPAFGNQLNHGIVQLADTTTMPLHPVQLYLLLGCMLTAFVVWKTKNRWHAPLSLLMFGWLLYSVLRFAVEFLRDPVTNHGAGYVVFGLKALQWYLLATSVVFGLILIARERKLRYRVKRNIIYETGLGRQISLLLFIILISLLFRGLFGYVEKLLLNSVLLAAVILVGCKVFKTYTLPQYRVATSLSILCSCALLGQSYIPQNKNEKIIYTEIGGGLQFSEFYSTLATNVGKRTDCNGDPYYATENPFNVKYDSYTGGFSFAKTENRSKYNRFSYGFDAYFGMDKETGVDTVFSDKMAIVAAHPFISASGKWIGFSAGLHIGTFHYADILVKGSSDNVGKTVGGPRPLYVYPSASLRIGPSDVFYVEPFMAYHATAASPVMLGGIGVGTGLGKLDGRNIGIGYGTSGVFFKTMFPVKENLYLDGFITFRNNQNPDIDIENTSRFGMSIGVHHRFNYKTVAVPVTTTK